MKKTGLLVAMLAGMTVLATGCFGGGNYGGGYDNTGAVVNPTTTEEIVGQDWRTWKSYSILEWNCPTGTKNFYVDYDFTQGCVLLLEDTDTYTIHSECYMQDGIGDENEIEKSLEMTDYNNDGFDDFACNDVINNGASTIHYVFLFNPDNNMFEYSAEDTTDLTAASQQSADFTRIAGDWYVDGDLSNGHVNIMPDGTVTGYTFENDPTFEGYVELAEEVMSDGSVTYNYHVFDQAGSFQFGFPCDISVDEMTEFSTGQDGETRYVRYDYCQ